MLYQTQFTPGRQFAARLLPGEDLVESLKNFCSENKITSAYIPMLIGAVELVELIHPDPKPIAGQEKPIVKRYEGPVELTAQGTIATDAESGNLSLHLHAVVGGQEHKLVAMGHFVSGIIAIIIAILIEVVIIESADKKFVRKIDKSIFTNPVLFFE